MDFRTIRNFLVLILVSVLILAFYSTTSWGISTKNFITEWNNWHFFQYFKNKIERIKP